MSLFLPLDDPSGDGGNSGGGSEYPGGGGGSTPGAPAASGAGFETISVDEGALLALAYGEHLVIGSIPWFKPLPGPPPVLYVAYAQGDGEWAGLVKAWYAGEELTQRALTDLTPGVHFHRGTLSTGDSDPDQGIDTYILEAMFPTVPVGLTFNKTAYTVAKLPERYSTEQRPDKFAGRYRCLLIDDYDDTGTLIGSGFNAWPACVAAEVLLKRAKLPSSRIDWPSWVAWRGFCAATISWNDGTTTHSIPRFEAHVVFTGPVDVPAVLDALCGVSCCRWQDDGEKIRFLLPTDTTSQHTFTENNIVTGSVVSHARDVQVTPRHLLLKFRDTLDERLTETSWGESKRQLLVDSFGDLVSERRVPNMNHSQAQRIAEYQLRMETDYNQIVELTAKGDSLHLLPGDFATMAVSDSLLNGSYLILDATDNSPERTPDERRFTLQKITGALYSDDDHRPIQRSIAT